MVGIPGAFIPNKIRSEDPETDEELLKGNITLNTIVKDGDVIWIEFNQDGGKITKWENETFYATEGRKFKEERDTYELVEEALEDEPEISDADFYGKEEVKKTVVKKELRRSFFLERSVESGGKSFFETKNSFRKCFKVDWKKVKKVKWMKEDNILPELKKCIYQYYALFANIYQFYSATGEGDPFDMGMNDFQELLRTCNIGDIYLGSIWYAVNFHGKKQAKSESGEVIEHDADKNSLSRYEFIEVLFRLAEEIFLKSKDIKIKRRQHREAERKKKEMEQKLREEGKLVERDEGKKGDAEGEKGDDASGTVAATTNKLVNKTFLHTNECESVLEVVQELFSSIAEGAFKAVDLAELHYADPDSFRRERLYFLEVDQVFQKYSKKIYTIYIEYADKSMNRAHSTGNKEPKLYLAEYYNLLQDSGANKGLSKSEITLAFVSCQMQSPDPLSGGKKKKASQDGNDRCTFMEFCDCLARLSDLKADGFGTDKDVTVEQLPKLSVVLEPFLEKLCSGFTRSFWTANSPLNDYDEYIDKKYGGYERLWKKYGPGPEEGRSENDASDEEQMIRLELRADSAVTLPKILQDRLEERDTLRRSDFLKERKMLRDKRLKEEVIARRKAGSMGGASSGGLSKR